MSPRRPFFRPQHEQRASNLLVSVGRIMREVDRRRRAIVLANRVHGLWPANRSWQGTRAHVAVACVAGVDEALRLAVGALFVSIRTIGDVRRSRPMRPARQ
jgi:hypothetical protein